MSSKIYEPKGKAREYSPLALNYYKGCDHGCVYCYVPPMMKRFNSSYDHGSIILGKTYDEVLASIEQSAKKFANTDKQVLLSFTSDPYNGLDKELKLTRKVLEILLKYNIPTSVLTKNPWGAINDLNIFKKFKSFAIGSTLTFCDAEDSKKYEPNAMLSTHRIDCLKVFKEEGLTTWASFEPVIDPVQSLELLELAISQNAISFAKIGKLNNYKGLDKDIDWHDFLVKAVNICRFSDTPFYIKKDLAAFKFAFRLHDHEVDMDYLTMK